MHTNQANTSSFDDSRISKRKKSRLRRSNISAKTGAFSGIRQWGSKRMRGPVTRPRRI